MLKILLLLSCFWTAQFSFAQDESKAQVREVGLLRDQLRLVGFIRIGSSDQQSLVVLKSKDGARTMILRPEDTIPGTAFQIVRLGREELVVRGPAGEELIPLETTQEIVSATPIAIREDFPSARGPGSGSFERGEGENFIEPAPRGGGRGRIETQNVELNERALAPSPHSDFEGSNPMPPDSEQRGRQSEMPCLDGNCPRMGELED